MTLSSKIVLCYSLRYYETYKTDITKKKTAKHNQLLINVYSVNDFVEEFVFRFQNTRV